MLSIRFIPTPTAGGKPPLAIVTLGDDSDGIYISGYTRDGSSIEQIVELLRAEQIQQYDRGNFRTRVTFRASRVFASPAENLDFIHTHPEDITGVGTLIVAVAGPFFTQWTLPRAKVKIRNPIPRGIHLFLDYEVLGGKFTQP